MNVDEGSRRYAFREEGNQAAMASSQRQQRRRTIIIAVAVVLTIAVVMAIALPLSLRDSDSSDEKTSGADSNKGSQDSGGKTGSSSMSTIGPDGGDKGGKSNPPQVRSGTPSWDCFPEAEGDRSKVSKSDCIKRGCHYDDNEDHTTCAYKPGQYQLKVLETKDTAMGKEIKLQQIGKAPFGGDITSWVFRFENRGDNVARFTFDTEGDRFKVPKEMNLESTPSEDPNYKFEITDTDSFAFQIIRKDTNTVVWDTGSDLGSLILSNQFLQVSNRLPSTNVFGLGEHIHKTFRHDMGTTWPSFSRDQPPSWDTEANLYGVHPFYTCVEDEAGNTHGVLMLNSNAQEYAFSSNQSLTFRTIGGILDFYLFLGPTPENVIQQYTGVIGRPYMPPYWSLGFQLCQYGYNSIANLKDAVESTARYEIPHDVQYVDIDHMDREKIFTVNNETFPNLNEYFLSLRDQGMRIIYILDPCLLSNDTTYEAYNRLKQQNGFVKWKNPATIPADSMTDDGSLLGYVWPHGKTVFVDFMKQSARTEWKNLIKDHRDTLVFDGLWIDMNEPANFGTNEERPFNWPEDEKPYWSLKCPKNMLEDPPYRTKAGYKWDTDSRKARISDKTICMSAVQGDEQYDHYDVHSLYGWSQTKPTLEAVQEATGERGIVISRSTFPGSGKYTGHWLGDNVSDWPDLHRSIIGLLEFNLFGVPYIGADICGFFNNATTELCTRWMQLGAFYTFSRNHNTLGAKPQGPGQMGDGVGFASRDIMRVRYQLLPYLYTLFYEAHTQGGTVIRPLHHEFPTDSEALGVDRQFLWGSCLLISPILEKGQTELKYYLPKGKWYNYFTNEIEMQTQGSHKSVSVNLDSQPLLHIRGGYVIVQQDYANNTYFSRQNPLSILAALDKQNRGNGGFYWDDGNSIDPLLKGEYLKADLSVKNNALEYKVAHEAPGSASWAKIHFRQATVLGVETDVKSVTLIQGATSTSLTTFNHTNSVLDITLPQVPMTESFQLKWN